jgi:hypothetical protein
MPEPEPLNDDCIDLVDLTLFAGLAAREISRDSASEAEGALRRRWDEFIVAWDIPGAKGKLGLVSTFV